MKALLKDGVIVLIGESEDELEQVASWGASHADHAFALRTRGKKSVVLHDLGPRPVACREPINVSSRTTDEVARLISNFAHTPFELDGRTYASVEGFWQGLKFPDEADRARIAQLHGAEAKRAGSEAPEADTFEYDGKTYRIGTYEHWTLMYHACLAKFSQDARARQALLSTVSRPLAHRMRRDSRTIPGAVMADLWMKVRKRLTQMEQDGDADVDGGDEDVRRRGCPRSPVRRRRRSPN